MACVSTLTAQLTLVEGQDFEIEGTTLESSMSTTLYMVVGDEDFGEFFWGLERSTEMPADWRFSVCDLVTCYNFGVEECPQDKPNIIGTQDTIAFSLYLNNEMAQGKGDVTLSIWPKGQANNPLIQVPVSYDVQFASSTIDTEIVTDVVVTPNPVSDFLTVDVESSEVSNIQLEVINSIGQVVATQTVNVSNGGNTVRFDAADYSNGVYSIITRSDAGITTTKFFVAK